MDALYLISHRLDKVFVRTQKEYLSIQNKKPSLSNKRGRLDGLLRMFSKTYLRLCVFMYFLQDHISVGFASRVYELLTKNPTLCRIHTTSSKQTCS